MGGLAFPWHLLVLLGAAAAVIVVIAALVLLAVRVADHVPRRGPR